MDRFIIKNPKSRLPENKAPTSKKKGFLKQATLHSLKRVVVLEDIKRWKCILELPNQTKENLIEALSQLKKKIPSEEVIRSTKIGEAVESLQMHPDEDISQLANEVHSQWETFLKENQCKPTIEVRCDAATEKLRTNARKMLGEALEKEVGDPLVECIEREVFHQSSRLINVHYRRTVRTLVFALKHKPEIRLQVKDGLLPVNTLVKAHKM